MNPNNDFSEHLGKKMKLSELSGDSSMRGLHWKSGSVSFIFEDYDTEKTFKIEIEAQRFYSEKDEEEGSVHLRLEKAIEFLPIEKRSKIYIMPDDFGKQMELNRRGFQVMLGLDSRDYPFILTAQGYKKLLVCPVKKEEDVKIQQV